MCYRTPFCVDLVQCEACGFIFYNPRLDDTDLRRLYSNYRSEEYQQMRHASEIERWGSHISRLGLCWLQPGVVLAREADEGDPLAVVLLLPDEVAVELEGDEFGREIVVEAEVALVDGFGAGAEAKGQRGRVVLGAEDESGGVLFRLLGGSGDLIGGEVL
jgi:hypothetical protein